MSHAKTGEPAVTSAAGEAGGGRFTQASADRASEVATFFSDPLLVHDLRVVFYD